MAFLSLNNDRYHATSYPFFRSRVWSDSFVLAMTNMGSITLEGFMRFACSMNEQCGQPSSHYPVTDHLFTSTDAFPLPANLISPLMMNWYRHMSIHNLRRPMFCCHSHSKYEPGFLCFRTARQLSDQGMNLVVLVALVDRARLSTHQKRKSMVNLIILSIRISFSPHGKVPIVLKHIKNQIWSAGQQVDGTGCHCTVSLPFSLPHQ